MTIIDTTLEPVTVKIVLSTGSAPEGKLADAELHFHEGPLAGLKLVGFGVWQARTGKRRNVTYPARQYSVDGERRSYALLRPMADAHATHAVRDLILAAYAEVEAREADPAGGE